MKYIDILKGFEIEINSIDDVLEKPSTEDSLYWLNQAVDKFIKLRFNGDFAHKTSFEQTEKRRRDLIKLFKEKTYKSLYFEEEPGRPGGPIIIDPDDISSRSVVVEKSDFTIIKDNPEYNQYDTIENISDLLFLLDETAIIADKDGNNETNTSIFECTRDSYMYRIKNSLTDFHYHNHRARPIRIALSDGYRLFTDKNYQIISYTIGYLRKPNKIVLDKPFEEYKDFEDNIMPEIIKMAAQMYLENKQNPRYQTISGEVLTQE